MRTRVLMTAAGAVGAIWAAGVVWVGVEVIDLPIFTLAPTLLVTFLGPGLILALMVFWSAMRRFLTPALHDGAGGVPGSAMEIDARVLRNTVEQIALALCLWPAIGFLAADDGPGLLVALTVSFPLTRIAFWIGYRISPPLRIFGFSATFFATVFALLWAGAFWLI